ncbi:MAG: hypothetical protein KDD37_11765, partial [Bdellovibrionales bacterium]|nr:hypothetical protein [Bdellovibrionales bacterium]
ISFAFSDLMLSSEFSKDGESVKSITYLSSSDFLVESPTKKSGLLYLGDKDQFYIIDHKDKKMTTVSQKDLFIYARKRAKLSPNTKEIKKDLPALFNSELESMLDEILKTSDMSYQKLNIRIEAAKDDRKWKKHSLRRYDAIVDGKKTLSLWLLPHKVAKLSKTEIKSIVVSAKLLRFFISSMGQETSTTVEAAYLKALEKEPGILVYTEQFGPLFKVDASSKLVEFKRVKSLSSKFKVPLSYTQASFVPK